MEDNEVPDNIFDDKAFMKKAIYLGSRCAWGFLGGMVLLMFMTQNLYNENILYPYAAKIAGLLALILAAGLDATYQSMKGTE